MAEPIKISELPIVGDVSTSAMFPMSQTGADGLATYKATAADLSKALMSDFVYSDLETESKNAIGAINESARKVNALQSIVDGIKVEFQKNHAEGDFTFKSGVIGSVLQGLQGKSEKTKNLLKPTLGTTTQNGVTCTANGDGTYTLNGTATATTYFHITGDIINKYKGLKLVGCPTGGLTNTYGLYMQDRPATAYNFDYGNGIVINHNNNLTVEVNIYINNGYTCNNLVFKPMITEDLSATYDDFEPYFDGLKNSAITKFSIESKDYPITFDGKSAGSARDEVDLVSKKYIRRVGSVDLGTLDWLYNSTYKRFTNTISGAKGVTGGNVPNALISIYSVVDATSVLTTGDMVFSITANGTVVIRNSNFTTAVDFKTAMSGVILNYELAEPVIEDITETEIMAVVNSGDSVTFDGDVSVGSDWNDLVFLKGV